jgi:sugar phosphate isomerase/epimerase
MQLGIFAKTFAGSDPLAVLKAVAAAGYQTCQYNMACSGLSSLPDTVTAEQVQSLKSASATTGIGIAAISATYNMIHPDTAVRDAGLRSLEVLADVARDLRIPMLTLCTGSRNAKDQWTHHPDNQTAEAWHDMRGAMAQALDVAERYNLVLGVEPEHANVVNSAPAARRLLDEMKSRHLKIVLDPANLVRDETGQDQKNLISAAFELTGEAIAMAHAKDRDASGKFATAGHGMIDFTHFFGKVKELRRDIPIVTHGLGSAEASAVSRFLTETWEKA